MTIEKFIVTKSQRKNLEELKQKGGIIIGYKT